MSKRCAHRLAGAAIGAKADDAVNVSPGNSGTERSDKFDGSSPERRSFGQVSVRCTAAADAPLKAVRGR
jgi:hypothetical protein